MALRRSGQGPWSEIEEMISGMQKQFGEAMERLSGAPLGGGAGAMIDVLEHESDVVVVADLPGVQTEEISVRLLDPRTLRVAARREEAKEEEQAGYHMRERRVGAISRTVTLPTDVREEEAHATFKNGVLEVRLKKVPEDRGKEIPIGGEAAAESRGTGTSAAEERRQQVEQEYREAREKMEPSGYPDARAMAEAAEKIELEETGSPEEQRRAAELRRQKEKMFEEGKKKLG
ncbi:Hsp20/alpha crystallin family protein [Methanoculleus sp. Wushi-C6]|uniref:Hsp20/alpha crystallin family protein n=1 Tax=Methanoculleus caldifontis TaxID=2651577 RepID=A0ABU3X3U0_9EURY|nr:Hsp20/alpha crystallin family protein [Methanoculleus sp. Wushi-C6]MDV2482729.1 Hsp20/alpha crystallin family protein [Methanoculleus sp. Wushi-C6]